MGQINSKFWGKSGSVSTLIGNRNNILSKHSIAAEVEEEVFAENYDDQEDERKYKSSSHFDDSVRGGFTRDEKNNFMVRTNI